MDFDSWDYRKFGNLKFAYQSTFHLGYSALKVYSRRQYPTSFRKSVPRSNIYTFSKRSRKNMLFKLQLLDYDYISKSNYQNLFITLTYQSSFFRKYKTISDIKRDVNVFSHRLSRFFSRYDCRFFFVYKLEFTRQGIPHFHLFLVSTMEHTRQNTILLRKYISRIWVEILTSNISISPDDFYMVERMKKASTNVRPVPYKRSKQAIYTYLNKEVSKTVDVVGSFGWVGRFWGIYGRKFFKDCSLSITFRFYNREHFFKFRRSLFRYLKSKGLSVKSYRYSLRYNFMSGLTLFYIHNVSRFLELFYFYAPLPDS